MKEFKTMVGEIRPNYVKTGVQFPKVKISCSADCYKEFSRRWSDDIELYESFSVIYMNVSNDVIGHMLISVGGVSGTIVDPKKVFSMALACNATSLICAHNHPSGSKNPSRADIAMTKQLKKGGELLGVNVFDHIILTPNGYYSFADNDLI